MSGNSSQKPKILVVDDSKSSIDVIVQLLSPEYRLCVAKSGPNALTLAAGEDTPDLILLDVLMPEMDGYETCRRLKADPITQDIPIIFLTVKSEVESETQGLDLGAVDYIAKPVNPPILLARVRNHITLHRIQQNLEGEVRLRTAELEDRNLRLREREAELRWARDAAEAADQAKSAFLSVVSHELRTPLNGIQGLNDILAMRCSGGREQQHLRMQRTAVSALTQVINDLLTLSDMDSRDQPRPLSEFDLGEMLESVADLFRIEAAEKGVALEVNLAAGLALKRLGEPCRIRQLLMVLTGNALKFTSQGSVRLEAENLGSGLVRIQVRDTGIGIAAEDRERIFEPFIQADLSNTRRYSGSGLGLTIARRLIDDLGGKLELQSETGKGSTFGVELALLEVPA